MLEMPRKGTLTGVILIVLGVIGYFGGGMVSMTALIPAFFGVPILVASLLARNPDRLKLGMHIAAVFGLLGFLAPLGRIIPQAGRGLFSLNLATGMMIAMCLVCLWFTVQCIQSFRAARRAKA